MWVHKADPATTSLGGQEPQRRQRGRQARDRLALCVKGRQWAEP
jgi:hypothetical protein